MIERQLKDYNWAYDTESQTIILNHTVVENGILETIQMDRTRMFSLMRFMIRVAQCKKKTITSKKQITSSVKSSVPLENAKDVVHQMELCNVPTSSEEVV